MFISFSLECQGYYQRGRAPHSRRQPIFSVRLHPTAHPSTFTYMLSPFLEISCASHKYHAPMRRCTQLSRTFIGGSTCTGQYIGVGFRLVDALRESFELDS